MMGFHLLDRRSRNQGLAKHCNVLYSKCCLSYFPCFCFNRLQIHHHPRLMDQRFTRLESHVITLARSVAHLSSELRSQNKIRQHLAGLQKDVYELTTRRNNEMKYLQERVRLIQTDRISQKRIRKLRRYLQLQSHASNILVNSGLIVISFTRSCRTMVLL